MGMLVVGLIQTLLDFGPTTALLRKAEVSTAAKFSSVLTTVVAGLILRDYRTLIIGIIAGYTLPIFLSYLWHPYRPRWNTSAIGEICMLTKWLMVARIAQFTLRKGDELITARISTTHQCGLYSA